MPGKPASGWRSGDGSVRLCPLLALLVCLTSVSAWSQDELPPGYEVDDLLVGACRLPPKLKKLGTKSVRLGPRKVVMATGVECGIVGGEFVAYDPTNWDTARKFWTAQAKKGDAKSQNYLGEIYERGLGTDRDFRQAAKWYRKAAEQGYAPAQFNLGKLYELGQGVTRDMEEALRWYRSASGLQNLDIDPGRQVEPAPQIVSGTDGPIIRMIDPLVAQTRGITVVSTPKSEGERLVVGRVESRVPLRSLTVNDTATSFQTSGLFEAPVRVLATGTMVHIVAIDSAGRRGERTFRLNPSVEPSGLAAFGRYFALVIGIQNYTSLQPLSTPLNDARDIAGILEKRYGFDVRLLEDATRADIMRALNTFKNQLTETDNLLIYYAGHGDLDELNSRGHWLPRDADSDDSTNWVPNTAITDILNHMKARGVLVVSDSCYAGALLRSNATSMTVDVEILRRKRSRTALTSGGLAPVLDNGHNGHSVFANALIDALNSNAGVLDAQQLLLQIRAKVAEAAMKQRVEQVPLHGVINLAGHENGAFFFVPRVEGSGFVASASAPEPFEVVPTNRPAHRH